MAYNNNQQQNQHMNEYYNNQGSSSNNNNHQQNQHMNEYYNNRGTSSNNNYQPNQYTNEYYNDQGSASAYNNNYQQNQYTNEYYNDQGNPSNTSNYPPTTRVQELNQKYLTKLDTGNNSTKSLGGATAVGTPRFNPVENTGEVDPINSQSLHPQQQGIYNATALHQQPYGQSKYPVEPSSHPGDEYYSDTNQNTLNRQNDPSHTYYDEEATRHNTLTSRDQNDPNSYGFENDYTDRDFPGGGKGARQSMTGEYLSVVEKKKKKCCGCCTLPICLLITLIILLAFGVTGFFVFPRIPKVDVKDGIPLSPPTVSTNPPFINMDFKMIVEIQNTENYVPYRFNKIDVAIFDRKANNGKTIATGTKLNYTLQPKRVETIEFPLSVNYTSQDLNDPVIKDFIDACSPEGPHTPLKLKVDVTLFVWGIDWVYKPKIPVDIPDIKCPEI